MHFPHSLKNPTKPVLSVFSTSILIVNFPFLIINASFALMPTDGISSYKSKWLSTDKPMSKSQEYGLHTLVAKDPLTAGVTDVVAVHGLNGHYEKTWTEEVSQYNWLRDTFPGPTRSSSSSSSGSSLMVRVMSFAYSSKVQFSRSTASIHDFASQLLECLLVERQSDMEKRRPIVFICHSLGGIVFKQAFNMASTQSRYQDLAKRSIGVLFFGTPHKGSAVASYATTLGNLLKASSLGRHTNTQLLKDLAVHSSTLEQVSDTFLQFGTSLRVVTFYETEKVDGLSSLIVDEMSAIMRIRSEVSVPLQRNHRNLCKFSSRHDKMLELVMYNLLTVVNQTTKQKELDLKDLLLKSLATSNPDLHKARNPQPVPGTCSWVLDHTTYTRWLASPMPGLLWLSADPGCGKSVLASFLIDHLREQQISSNNMNICYFFFKSDNIEQHEGVSGLRSLLHQLLQLQPELLDFVSEILQTHQIGNIETLWHTLIETLQQPIAHETVFIIDGLDECEQISRRLLTINLSKHFAPRKQTQHPSKSLPTKDSPVKLKVIVLSRPENSLKAAFDRPSSSTSQPVCSMIRLRGEDETDAISRDIGLVIDAEIAEIVDMGLPEELLVDFRRELVARADRTFLWATLIIQLVKERAEAGASRRELEDILHSRDIDTVYAGLLAGRTDKTQARKLLSLVLAATRPLSVEELSIALAIKPEFDTFEKAAGRRKPTDYSFSDIEDDLVYPFENHIKALCGHFIRVIRNKIYLVHETARDFLLETQEATMNENDEVWFALDDENSMILGPDDAVSYNVEPSLPWKSSINMLQCHSLCLEVCVTYLYCMGKKTPESTLGRPSQRTAPFLDYAATAWVTHFSHVRDDLDLAHFSYYQNLCHPMFPGFTTWIDACARGADRGIPTNPGGADDDVQDYYVALFKMDTEGYAGRVQSAKDRMQSYLSSNPGTAKNHYFPVSADSKGWVSLDLDREDYQDALLNHWRS